MIKDILNANENITAATAAENKLKAALPQCFDKEGNFCLEKLQELLKKDVSADENYELNFLGKSYGRLLQAMETDTVITPDEEHNSLPQNANSENLYITGDNLDALKHLLKSYENKIKCIEEMLNNKKDGILKDVEVINKDDYEKGTNIIFSDWNNQFECTEIDLQNNVINIPDKKFYEYIARMEELDTLNIILKYFEQNINNKNIEFLPISNLTNQNPILNFDDYNLISNFIENNKKMNNQLNNIGIYKKQVCLFYLKQEKFQINNNDLLVFNMNKIYYSILENEIQLMKIIQETYDVIDWVDWITKIDDVNQKEIIKKYILENYIELSQINNYKKFIINNFEYINKIKSEWIFSDLININDFQKMANINNIKIINILTSSSIHSFENSDINGINKINYLFNEYGFSLNDLNNPSLEVKHDLEIINEITRLQNSNNINLIKEAINKREKVFFTESENKYKELESKYNQLIKENKDLIIEEIYNLMSKQIIGKLDEFLRKLSNNLNTKSSLHDNLKIIEEKKILNKNTIEKLRWIKDERNKFAHSSETMFKDTLLESSLEFLNDYHSKLKIIIEEMEKRNNESFN